MVIYIIFIPGLKGSVLKYNTRTVWPPALSEFLFGIKNDKYNNLKYSKLIPEDIIYDLECFGIPYFSVYRFITNELKREYGQNMVKVFPYDWRRSIEESTDRLFVYLQSMFSTHDSYFYLVGHSLGGIIATNILKYKNKEPIKNKLLGICTIASPLLGSFDAFVYLYLLKSKTKYYANLLTTKQMHSLLVRYQSIYDLIPYNTIAKRVLINNNSDKSIIGFLNTVQTFMKDRLKTLPHINKLIDGYKFSVNFKKRLFDFNHNCTRINITVGGKSQLEVVDLRYTKSQGVIYWYDYHNSGDGIVNFTNPQRLTINECSDINENVHTSICKNKFTIDTIIHEINRTVYCFINKKMLLKTSNKKLFF